MMGIALFFRYRRLLPTLLAMISSDSKSTHACRMAVCNSLDDNFSPLFAWRASNVTGEPSASLADLSDNPSISSENVCRQAAATDDRGF